MYMYHKLDRQSQQRDVATGFGAQPLEKACSPPKLHAGANARGSPSSHASAFLHASANAFALAATSAAVTPGLYSAPPIPKPSAPALR